MKTLTIKVFPEKEEPFEIEAEVPMDGGSGDALFPDGSIKTVNWLPSGQLFGRIAGKINGISAVARI